MIWGLVLILSIYYLVFPPVKKLIKTRKEIKLILREEKGSDSGIKKLDETLASYQKEYEEIRREQTQLVGILNKEEVTSFLQDWARIASMNKVAIVNLKLGTPTPADLTKIFQEQITLNAQELPIDITLIGRFNSLQKFFKNLENLNRLPRVEKMQISSDESKNSNIRVEMQLKLYIGVGG